MLSNFYDEKGIILNIEKFAIHDGPGIRTVVFLKGCPLRCRWCTAPDSQNKFPEMEYFVNKCVSCAKCVQVCPTMAISISNSGEVFTDIELCNHCGKCANVCSTGARKMAGEEMTVREVLKEVEKDTIFYWNSGGGITLSGGEPTMQPQFSLGILKMCKERGIHTAIETCGYVKWDILDEILKYLDLVYMDIKHISPTEHEKLTGKRNELICGNAQRIAMKYPDIPLIIRIPVVPGVNDSNENIIGIVELVRKLKGEHKIELLPYHRLGVSKYGVLFRDYLLAGLEPPSADRMRHLEELVQSYGIQVQTGG
jgi:pyruvate formate lyase activating enzyme